MFASQRDILRVWAGWVGVEWAILQDPVPLPAIGADEMLNPLPMVTITIREAPKAVDGTALEQVVKDSFETATKVVD